MNEKSSIPKTQIRKSKKAIGCLFVFLVMFIGGTCCLKIFNSQLNDFEDDFLNAAYQGDIQTVRHFLETGKDPNFKSHFGNNALTLAAYQGNTEVLKLLIEHGGKIEIVDDSLETPLLCAVNYNHIETTEWLINQSAHVNVINKWGQFTPLTRACMKGNPAMVELLLKNGACVNHRDERGWQPLHSILRAINPSDQDRIKIVKLLLKYGADPNADNPGGWEDDSNHDSRPLPSFSRTLSNQGNTPKAIAASNGFKDILKILNQPQPSVTKETD